MINVPIHTDSLEVSEHVRNTDASGLRNVTQNIGTNVQCNSLVIRNGGRIQHFFYLLKTFASLISETFFSFAQI
jgi:hypothetical protein